MKLTFKPEDFDTVSTSTMLLPELICFAANKRLAEMLAEAPVVYGQNKGYWGPEDADVMEFDTHKARLVNIEELENK